MQQILIKQRHLLPARQQSLVKGATTKLARTRQWSASGLSGLTAREPQSLYNWYQTDQ